MAQRRVCIAKIGVNLMTMFPSGETVTLAPRQQILSKLRNTAFHRQVGNFFTDSRRYAGHNKWSNIKHIKAEKDQERNVLFNSLRRQMRVAIAEGGSADPLKNIRLAQVIDMAKKSNMPVTSIQITLSKLQKSSENSKNVTFEVRGPGGCALLIHCNTSNAAHQKMMIAAILRKNSAHYSETSLKHLFDHRGIIITEHQKNIEKAIEDAISVDAEEVEEFEDNDTKHFKFICDPSSILKVRNKLESMKYTIITHEEVYTPKTLTTLNDDHIRATEKLFDKLLAVEEVEHIDHNIA